MSTSFDVWERQSRTFKGLSCLVIGFAMSSIVTYFIQEGKESSTFATAAGSTQKPLNKDKIHSSGFGGIKNIAQPAGAKAHAAGLGLDIDFYIPTSNLGHAIPSLFHENIINLRGHYVHDEHRSPYASHLYQQSKEYLDEQQVLYIEQMKAIRQEWGAWMDVDDYDIELMDRPIPDFTSIPYGDLSNSELPLYSWQADEEYVGKFIPEARALIQRLTEGIYAEYGHPLRPKDGPELSSEQVDERDAKFRIHVLETEDGTTEALNLERDKFNKDNNGIAWLTKAAMDGLVRKLLHALITNDEFYIVLAGHSAAAGHGNNFMQNKIMTAHHILEPVFDKLGMRLVSRNMAMGGVGTFHFSLAGKALCGEADVMFWDSGMTERGGTVDFFNKQAMLAGARLPILFTTERFAIMEETEGAAWIGDIKVNTGILPLTVDELQVNEVPYAARYMNTNEARLANLEKFNAICWEPRSDFTPSMEQDSKVGSQVGWHPGFRRHQFEGRIITLIMLEGLKRALDLWEEGIAKDGFPLAEKYWHVGKTYESLRETFRTLVNVEKEDGSPAMSVCETTLSSFPRICRVAMQGYGMWTPRIGNRNFLDIVKAAPNGYKPTYHEKMAYDGFDVLPINQKIPHGEIDVHAIAIATWNPPPDLNHDWIDDEHQGDRYGLEPSSDPPTRRWLRAATDAALKRSRGELYQLSHSNQALSKRRLVTETSEEIIPGRGWQVTGWVDTNGFCDGSSTCACGRPINGRCLALGHNDQHLALTGNSLSGWLVFTLPKIEEGIILVRMEWWCGAVPTITNGWTEVNNGKTYDTTPDARRRQTIDVASRQEGQRDLGYDSTTHFNDTVHLQRKLKPTLDELVPADFEMDYSVNGKIKTMNREEWLTHTEEFSKTCAVWPLLNDDEMAKREDWDGKDVEVAVRFRSKAKPTAGFCISHVYYA